MDRGTRFKQIFLIAVASLILNSCESRQIVFNVRFQFKKPSFREIDSIEKLNGGKLLSKSEGIRVSKDYFPNAGKFQLGNPRIYLRDSNNIEHEVSYFYSKNDSIVRLIEYAWRVPLHIKNNYLTALYNHNDSLISRFFGNNGLSRVEKIDWWQRNSKIWESDSLYVKQFMIITNEPERLRVLICWE